ncbi:MAG: peptide chain release factor 2 [Chloroflexi bacterium]|nr:peptide chain release factor 2 [Chloroflexota bacterium]
MRCPWYNRSVRPRLEPDPGAAPWKSYENVSPGWRHTSPTSWCGFDLPTREAEAKRLEALAAEPGFWDDPRRAQAAMRDLARLRETISGWEGFERRVTSTVELFDLAIDSGDASIRGELEAEASTLFAEAEEREFELVLSGEHDHRGALLAIHAGAGGTDSQDWAQMLVRMYTRWAEHRGYKAIVLDMSPGEEAGIKSATLELTGPHAYGYAKAERGVHRLVRLSPYDAAHARHTSFALVEVLPEAEGDVDVQIDPDDIRMDVFRASGAGGQHVQKNSTAVRLTHLPSGLVVSCQNERSQLQNREVALKILRSRLMEREIARRAEERAKLKGEHVSAGWGNQIRSYVLHPYKLVKDHRTGHESTDPQAVLDGSLDPFIRKYLLSVVEAD